MAKDNMAVAYSMKRKAKKMAEGGDSGTSTTGNKTKTGGSNPGGASTGGAGTVTITTGKIPPKGINISNVGGKTDSKNAGGMDPGDSDDPMKMARGGMVKRYEDGGNVSAEPTPSFASDNAGAAALAEGVGSMLSGGQSDKKEDSGGGGGSSSMMSMLPMLAMAAAHGGMVERIMSQRASGYQSHDSGMHQDEYGAVDPELSGFASHEGNNTKPNKAAIGEDDKGLNQQLHRYGPLVEKIMMGRAKGYSKGGMVANGGDADFDNLADSKPANYDDLALRDTLESHYGDDNNSGDATGDAAEDHDRADIVARIMKSRAKKDRMPRPA